MTEKSVLQIMDDMVKSDNKGIMLSTTLTEVAYNHQGAKVSFGVEKHFGEAAEVERDFGVSDYMFMCFAVKKSEIEKYVTKNSEQN
jgi:hypothetical protein